MTNHDRIRLDLCCAARLLYRNVEVDFSGTVIGGDAYVNDTIRLHGIIHRENPRITVVMHTHPPAVVTFSAFRKVPEIFDQESRLLMDDVAVIDEHYEGLASEEERVMPIAPEAARRTKREIARIPVMAPLWQDFIERLHRSDPDLFAAESA